MGRIFQSCRARGLSIQGERAGGADMRARAWLSKEGWANGPVRESERAIHARRQLALFKYSNSVGASIKTSRSLVPERNLNEWLSSREWAHGVAKRNELWSTQSRSMWFDHERGHGLGKKR
eukprot:1497808-Pyramimonas_sp.AAC.1